LVGAVDLGGKTAISVTFDVEWSRIVSFGDPWIK